MNSEDERSTDGSDNGSDLDDFLVNDEDGSDKEEVADDDSDIDEAAEAKTLLDEFPYDRSLLEENGGASSEQGAPRRSRRTRRAVQRYQDPNYMHLMMDDVDANALHDSDEDADREDSDAEFEVAQEESDDDDVEME